MTFDRNSLGIPDLYSASISKMLAEQKQVSDLLKGPDGVSRMIAEQAQLSELLTGPGSISRAFAEQESFSKRLKAEYDASGILAQQDQISELLAGQDSISRMLAQQEQISELLAGQDSISRMLAQQEQISELLTGQDSISRMLAQQEQISELLTGPNSTSRMLTELLPGSFNSYLDSISNQQSYSETREAKGTIPPAAVSPARGGSMDSHYENSKRLQREIERLREDFVATLAAMAKQEQSSAEAEQSSAEAERAFKELNKELEEKHSQVLQTANLQFLLDHIKPEAFPLLISSQKFRAQFFDSLEHKVFVVSVDIRKSTELMLKARTPKIFANFLTQLCQELGKIVKNNYGVFDKFTGDGILAFFPEFYSGPNSGLWALKTAKECHEAFNRLYREFRSAFITVLQDVGLGIGIDFGPAHLLKVAGRLTVVGPPVVYACRMSGAPSEATYLNQVAYEEVSDKFSTYCFFREETLDIKREGETLAYSVEFGRATIEPTVPAWVAELPLAPDQTELPISEDTEANQVSSD